jgi:tetratricopeptide (TPR) repeat protein
MHCRGLRSGWAALWLWLALLAPGCGRGDEAGAEAGTLTLYVLGSSTAWGEPYAPKLDFGLVARWLLGGRAGERELRVVNLAGPGKPSGDVVADARELAAEPHAPGSAVALLYLGNNEFLRFDSEHDLSRNERTLFDQPTTIAAVRAGVVQGYGENIAAIVGALQGAGIRVIATTVAVNLADWEPNRSVLARAANRAAVEELLGEESRARAAGDTAAAMAACERILALEPGFALASKLAGDAARALGRLDEARAHYQAAVDHDGNPYRETSAQNAVLREACARAGVPVVDAVARLEAAAPDGLLGFGLMWDNCHPTLEGYARIAEGFVAELEPMLGVERARELDLAALARDLGIDDAFLAQVYASRGQYCYVASTLTFDPAARLARGEQYLRRAQELAPADVEIVCSLAILLAMKGETEPALVEWRRAYALDPKATRKRARHPHVEAVMRRNGVGDLLALLRSE